MPEGDTYFRRGIQWFYGDDAYLQQLMPDEVGKKHVNELLGKHPWHPYVPTLPEEHPCFAQNALFGQCMSDPAHEHLELHMKHVTCYHPMKVELMKCVSREARKQRELAASGATPPAANKATGPSNP